MTAKESLDELLQHLPEERLGEVLRFTRFLLWEDEQEDWRQFGRAQLARAYGDDEPEYTEADVQPESRP